MSSISTDLPPTSQRYKHIPLDKTKKEIRLVQIQPDSDDKTLQLVLKTAILTQRNAEPESENESESEFDPSSHVEPSPQVESSSHVDLEDQDSRNSVEPVGPSEPIAREVDDAGNEFIALSYMWGPETPSHDILIVDSSNTGWISIRQTLLDFLITRRHSATQSPWFWIDQLCINQEDDQEKGHQVNQMSQLYSTATTVEVWLGLGFEGSDEAFDYMNQHIGTKWYDWPKQETSAHSSAFERIANLPYWSRLWIVQEVFLGHNITIRLGDKITSWRTGFEYVAKKSTSGLLHYLYVRSDERFFGYGNWGGTEKE
ncbi:hypothetical protein E8E13_010522 [Curvularia kusanoi]|uniref:Heterokaryon incompatibility domain-containing protein n=1 Tax=Curvularia kusanoi TaxID=90978 RepID=A0A9P4WDE0_CURKU|nr:hypothetical protein E8E13_010522 [Curvularia kusanoi]